MFLCTEGSISGEFSDSSEELEDKVDDGHAPAGANDARPQAIASKSGFSSSSSSSDDEEKTKINKQELRPELMGLQPQKASAADSAALVAQAVRRGSVSVANAKNKAAPSLRQFNDAKKKEKGHGDKSHRRNSRVIVMDDEMGGAAEKIERYEGQGFRVFSIGITATQHKCVSNT